MGLSYAEYAALVEQAPIMVWRSDPSGGCDYFNERWLDFTGRTMEQELGDGWAQGVHPDDLPGCLDTYHAATARRESFEMEYRLRRHDGAYRWIFDRGVPFRDAAGVFAGYIGSCVDVSERIEAAQALERLRQAELADLRGLLPICARCKRIRDDAGEWTQIELYISRHSRTDFSHGMCPDCLKQEHPRTWARLQAARAEPRRG